MAKWDINELAAWYSVKFGVGRKRAEEFADAHVHLYPKVEPQNLSKEQLRIIRNYADLD